MGNFQSSANAFGLKSVNVSCNGLNNGLAFICANPNLVGISSITDNVTITWKDGDGNIIQGPRMFTAAPEEDDSDLVMNLSPGNYSVEWFTNLMTEPVIENFVITEPPAMCVDVVVKGPTKAVAKVKNGDKPLRYKWRNCEGCLISTNSVFKESGPGVFTLEVIDANGCKGFKCFEMKNWLPQKSKKLKSKKLCKVCN